jgi:ethanolamine utilization protein EutN
MRLARVVGTVVCTAKNPSLEGKKILIVKPLDREGKMAGKTLIALDSVGAGIGEDVFYVGGKEASFPWHPDELPSDCSIVGILDQYNFEREPDS